MEDSGGVNPEMEQQAPEQTKVDNGHTEMELVFVLILIGLLGIGAFLYTTFSDEFKVTLQGLGSVEQEILDDELVGVDPDILAIRDDAVGKYFVHAKSFQILYTTTTECADECLDYWKPYTALDKIYLGNIFTIDREDTNEIQYTWKGQLLYTHRADSLDEWDKAFGNSYSGIWEIARP